jgi:transcriptional regulator with XRE-family HTH domain
MSELGNVLKALRGAESQASVAKATGLSLRTVNRAEAGKGTVDLATLRALAKYFQVSRSQFSRLLVSYLRLHLGADFECIEVRPRGSGPNPTQDTEEKFMASFRAVPARLQRELVRAIKRKEVLRSLEPINDLYDKLELEHSGQVGLAGQARR